MRRRLVLVAAATTGLVAIAFLVPLVLLVRSVARDRALGAAEVEAQSLGPVLALTTRSGPIEAAIEATGAGDDGRLSVFLADGRVLGAPARREASVALAGRGRAFSAKTAGGTAVLVPLVRPDGDNAVVRVFVPVSLLEQGVTPSLAVLVAVALILVAVAVAVADRLGRSVVRPVAELAAAARQLGRGSLATRVRPDGPPEVADVGEAFNVLADRMVELLAAEREMVADLSHRLRTPIAGLRLDVEALPECEESVRVASDVEKLERALTQLIADARRPMRPIGPGVADAGDVARDRVAFWSALADEERRPWALDLLPGPHPVPVDAGDLAAALDALLGNIFAHTPEGTGFRVVVGTAPTGAALLVVEDEGPGFAAPGLLLRGASGAGSSGLGLDIARRTAEATGGSFSAGTRPGGGARIELSFRGGTLSTATTGDVRRNRGVWRVESGKPAE